MRKSPLTFLRAAGSAGITAMTSWKLLPKPQIAHHHPLRYYLALPAHWSPERTWPILVAVDGANRGHFLWNFLRFRQARHHLPFILISPLVVSNSGHPNFHDYPYRSEVWAQMQTQGAVSFDAAGVLAIVDEMQQTYQGEPTFHLTGWSAGGHLAWHLIFTHPERLAGVVLAEPNYAGRGITAISTAPERAQLPIRGLQGDRDARLTTLNAQWQQATTLAAHHGYRNITRTLIPHAPHHPFPTQVFEALKHMRANSPSQ